MLLFGHVRQWCFMLSCRLNVWQLFFLQLQVSFDVVWNVCENLTLGNPEEAYDMKQHLILHLCY